MWIVAFKKGYEEKIEFEFEVLEDATLFASQAAYHIKTQDEITFRYEKDGGENEV